jgi:hypothetical protein
MLLITLPSSSSDVLIAAASYRADHSALEPATHAGKPYRGLLAGRAGLAGVLAAGQIDQEELRVRHGAARLATTSAGTEESSREEMRTRSRRTMYRQTMACERELWPFILVAATELHETSEHSQHTIGENTPMHGAEAVIGFHVFQVADRVAVAK